MSIHEHMGWVRYRERLDEMAAIDRERQLRRAAAPTHDRPRVSVRRRLGWGLMRVGARIAADGGS